MKPLTLSFSVFSGSSFSTFVSVCLYAVFISYVPRKVMQYVSPKYHLKIKQSIYFLYILNGQRTWKVSRVIHHVSLSKNVCTCWAAPPGSWEFSFGLWGWAGMTDCFREFRSTAPNIVCHVLHSSLDLLLSVMTWAPG